MLRVNVRNRWTAEQQQSWTTTAKLGCWIDKKKPMMMTSDEGGRPDLRFSFFRRR